MRRKDREITNPEKIAEIILSCHCCRVGFYDDGEIYIVPLNFGYRESGGIRTFYFHAAKEGRKIDLISKSPSVGFEMDTNYKLKVHDIACAYSASFQSVIGTGRITVVDSLQEKEAALQAIMYHNTHKEDWNFTEAMLNTVCIFKLEVAKLSCKEHA